MQYADSMLCFHVLQTCRPWIHNEALLSLAAYVKMRCQTSFGTDVTSIVAR